LYRKGELNQFIDTKDKTFLGVILGVDNWGKLRIRVENNQVKLFTNNEVKMILPTN
jgi:extradiol dioxygenase family protein